jgi:hypothetical protein
MGSWIASIRRCASSRGATPIRRKPTTPPSSQPSTADCFPLSAGYRSPVRRSAYRAVDFCLTSHHARLVVRTLSLAALTRTED